MFIMVIMDYLWTPFRSESQWPDEVLFLFGLINWMWRVMMFAVAYLVYLGVTI